MSGRTLEPELPSRSNGLARSKKSVFPSRTYPKPILSFDKKCLLEFFSSQMSENKRKKRIKVDSKNIPVE